jgi:hypothetical protein
MRQKETFSNRSELGMSVRGPEKRLESDIKGRGTKTKVLSPDSKANATTNHSPCQNSEDPRNGKWNFYGIKRPLCSYEEGSMDPWMEVEEFEATFQSYHFYIRK